MDETDTKYLARHEMKKHEKQLLFLEDSIYINYRKKKL